MNIWGIRRRPMPNEYGEYAEPVGLPYAAWTTVEEAERFPWPDPDWFDYDADARAVRASTPTWRSPPADFDVQDFINGVAFGRGVEQVLLDIAAEDPVYLVHRREAAPVLHGATSSGSSRPAAAGSTWCSAATISAASAGR